MIYFINRENLIKCLQENGWLDDTNIDELIETIPTAYSVDKVVEELGKLKNEKTIGSHKVMIKEAIEIVKQEAEQFGTDINVGSNGWIPCSERLPEDGGYYLVTYHEWSNGNFLPKYNDTYVRRMHYQKSERFTGWNYPRCIDDREENDTNREVIGWQPLPEVFKN